MSDWVAALLLWLAAPGLAPAEPDEARPRPDVVVRYGVVAPDDELRDVAARVLADPRGWSLRGRVRFVRDRRRADLTLYLAPPEEVLELGCPDPLYSCRVGRRVVINAERWRKGAAKWHGGLARYRAMVLNHEIGHWLGFGHRPCPRRGAWAPVMMQQSMGTGDCRENAWPLAAERAELRRRVAGGWSP